MKRRREILIELTPLLDVILIMIFILLTRAGAQTTEARDKTAEEAAKASELAGELQEAEGREKEALDKIGDLEKELERAGEERDALERQLLTQGLVMENSLMLTVSVAPDRTIRLEQNGAALATVSYEWGDELYPSNILRTMLSQQLAQTDKEAVFLVFQFDRSVIYRAEYEMIDGVMKEMKLLAAQSDLPLSLIEIDTQASAGGE